MYDSVLKWAQDAVESGHDFEERLSRDATLKHLFDAYDMHGLSPQEKKIHPRAQLAGAFRIRFHRTLNGLAL